MADKTNVTQILRDSMGFSEHYINRAFRVYEKNYGKNYNAELMTEIIFRLQQKDIQKGRKVPGLNQVNIQGKKETIPPAASYSNNKPPPAAYSNQQPVAAAEAPPPAYSFQQFQQPSSQPQAAYSQGNNAFQYQQMPSESFTASQSHGQMYGNLPSQPKPLQSSSSVPKTHAKQRSGHQSSPSRDATLRPNDLVYFKDPRDQSGRVHKAEVIQIEPNGRVRISYPSDAPYTERKIVIVHPQNLQKVPKKHLQSNSSSHKANPSFDKNVKPQPRLSSKPLPANPEHIPEFAGHLSVQEADKLRVHDEIDHRDEVGRFVHATIVEKQGSTLKIHYIGWSRKWDCYSDYRTELNRFAKAGSISKRSAHRFKHLKKGDFVDIFPKMRHRLWVVGEIRRKDKNSGQVQVVYEQKTKNFLYWAHLDDKEEIAEFTTRSGMQQDQQETVERQIKKERNVQHGAMPVGGKPKPQQAPKVYGYASPQDQMETFKLLRQKRFPKAPDEKIENHYGIGDWLEVQDAHSGRWITATVIDKENNWIVVHYDGFASRFDQRIHVVQKKTRLRNLGAGLAPDEMELEIKKEMEDFCAELKKWSWELMEIEADGNCLYRSFAWEIYGDQSKHMDVRKECIEYMTKNKDFFQNFIPDWDETIAQKSQQYEWGDHVDITALSEFYNVRVRVFELDKATSKLYMSFDQGQHEDCMDLPLILLGRHRKKHYNIIKDPQAYIENPRPLGDAKARNTKASVAAIRLAEEQRYGDEKNEEKDGGMSDDDDDEFDDRERFRTLFPVELSKEDFDKIISDAGYKDPIKKIQLKTAFPKMVEAIRVKLADIWKENHQNIDLALFKHFYDGRYGADKIGSVATNFISSLTDKVHSTTFEGAVVVSTFNQTVVSDLCINLSSVVRSQIHRQSVNGISISMRDLNG